MEIAYVSANKIHIEIEKRQEDFVARILRKLTKRPSQFIATMLVGNNIALVVYGFVMGDLLTGVVGHYFPSLADGGTSLLIQTIISTLVILLTAEFLPKVFFQIYANTFLKIFAVPAYLFYLLFWVISRAVIWISDTVLRLLFKTAGDEVQLTFSKIELGNYISEQMENVEQQEEMDSEIQIFQNALEFGETRAREVMVPRTEIEAVDQAISINDLREVFTSTGYSKILVYKENIDEVIGYVHSFDLFKRPETLKDVLIPVVFVPETIKIKDVLSLLIKRRKSVAVVLDEYGGTSGIMTVEDIVEELFGEIEDEHDTDDLEESKTGENEYRLSARLEVDYLNETYKLNLPDDDAYETLGGLIVHTTENLPNEKEVIQLTDTHRVTILEVSDNKINLVLLEVFESSN